MALKMNFSTNHGIDVTGGYIRIDEQSGTKSEISLRVRYYLSQEKALNNFAWLKEDIYSFVPETFDESSNFIKQGYEHLKTLDIFKNAIDC